VQTQSVELRRFLIAIELLVLLVIFAVAAGLRLGYPDSILFRQDEANFSRFALDMARGRDFPLLSIDSSVGIRNPPMTVYIMVIPYLFTTNPVIATAYVAVLGVLTVLVGYGLMRHYYGLLPAIIAGLLLATNPWMVTISRKIWDLLPLFLMLTLATGLLGFVEGRRWAQLLHLPMLSVIGQIHYATVAIVPITLFLLIVGRRRIKREFWLSIPLMILITLPFIIGAVREGYFNPQILARLGGRSGESRPTLTLSDQAWRESLVMISGAEAFYPAGLQRYPDDNLTYPESSTPLIIAFGVVLAASIVWMIVRARRQDRRAIVDITLLLCLITTPLLFTPTWTKIYTHYLIPAIPAALMIIGAAAGDLWGWVAQPAKKRVTLRRRWARLGTFGMMATALGVLTLLQYQSLYNHFRFEDVNLTGSAFTPLRYYMPARDYILSMKPNAVLVTMEGQYVGYHTEASVWDVLLYDVPLRRFADDSIEVYPAEPTPLLSRRCRETTRNFYLRSGEGCLSVEMRSKADFDETLYQKVPGNLKLENGIRPVMYRWMPTPTPCLALAWEADHPVPEDFEGKVHFTDAGGKVIAYGDGRFWRGRYWRAGDLFVRTHCLSDAARVAEIAGVRVGLYRQIEQQFVNVNVIDESGVVVGQEIAFPLISATEQN
jgi:4-amino-4-deoxy-L-arabinose transferase-like glycosyltransferase